MKTRTFQELYNYVFGDRANITANVEKHVTEYKRRGIKIVPDRTPYSPSAPMLSQSQISIAEIRNDEIRKCQKFFFPELIPADKKTNFRHALRRLHATHLEQALFGNSSDVLFNANEYQYLKKIEEKFIELENKYQYFSKSEQQEALQKFEAYVKVCALIAEFVEQIVNDQDAFFEHAYKMLVIFGNTHKSPTVEQKNSLQPKKYFNTFDQYIRSHGLREEKNPIHDVLVHTIPKNITDSPLHLSQWRQLILQAGPRSLRLFSRAHEIEQELKGNAPKNYQQALNIAKTIFFKNMSKDPELAELCIYYDVQETIFDECLKYKEKRKQTDNLPNISVAGKDVDQPGYYLVKLPINDPRAFILGHITNCCQSMGGHSELCVIDGIKHPDNGFYVLLKERKKFSSRPEVKNISTNSNPYNKDGSINYTHFEIVGQGYAWLSLEGNLTFDSWENLRPMVEDAVIVPMLRKFAYDVTHLPETSILRVTIGTGGKTPSQFETPVNEPEKIKTGYQYRDSEQQKLVYCNEELRAELLKDLHIDLQQLLNQIQIEVKPDCLPQTLITSVKKYNIFKSLLKNESFQEYLKQQGNFSGWISIINFHYDLKQNKKFFDVMEKLKNLSLCSAIKEAIEALKGEFMMEAAYTGNAAIVIALLKARVDINSPLKEGYTPLHWAKNTEIINILLEAKADINKRQSDGLYSMECTPLHYAIVYGRETSLALIEAKADCLKKDTYGRTTLANAVESDRISIIPKLLEVKVDIDEPDYYGRTPMHLAIGNKKIEMINLLIEARANLNAIDSKGYSLLNDAVYRGFYQCVEVMLDKKVDLTHKNPSGKTAIQVMAESREQAILAIYYFNVISQNQFIWVKNQVNKILEMKVCQNQLIHLNELKEDIDKFFVTESTQKSIKVLALSIFTKLFYYIRFVKDDYHSRSPLLKESKFSEKPLQQDFFQAISALLNIINKEFTWHPIKSDFLVASSFNAAEFFDPLPVDSIITEQAQKLQL